MRRKLKNEVENSVAVKEVEGEVEECKRLDEEGY